MPHLNRWHYGFQGFEVQLLIYRHDKHSFLTSQLLCIIDHVHDLRAGYKLVTGGDAVRAGTSTQHGWTLQPTTVNNDIDEDFRFVGGTHKERWLAIQNFLSPHPRMMHHKICNRYLEMMLRCIRTHFKQKA